MNSKVKIILGLGLIAIVVLGVFFSRSTTVVPEEIILPTVDPLDVVLDFYGEMQDASSNTVDFYQSETFKSKALSSELRQKINDFRSTSPEINPFTCQTSVTPERFRGRVYPTSETEVKIIVESRVEKETLPTMAFVTVTAVDQMWQITNIECTAGDIAPEVEFTYDREGLLLKSVPPPYEAGKWHLVFEQDGQMGYVTPLIFTSTTSCVSGDGVVTVCNPDTFSETTKVTAKGNMTELGAEVVQLEF